MDGLGACNDFGRHSPFRTVRTGCIYIPFFKEAL